jgi:hypothetical protein
VSTEWSFGQKEYEHDWCRIASVTELRSSQTKPAAHPQLNRSLFATIFLDPLQALVLSLRIADGLGQHLVQLSLGVCRFPLG